MTPPYWHLNTVMENLDMKDLDLVDIGLVDFFDKLQKYNNFIYEENKTNNEVIEHYYRANIDINKMAYHTIGVYRRETIRIFIHKSFNTTFQKHLGKLFIFATVDGLVIGHLFGPIEIKTYSEPKFYGAIGSSLGIKSIFCLNLVNKQVNKSEVVDVKKLRESYLPIGYNGNQHYRHYNEIRTHQFDCFYGEPHNTVMKITSPIIFKHPERTFYLPIVELIEKESNVEFKGNFNIDIKLESSFIEIKVVDSRVTTRGKYLETNYYDGKITYDTFKLQEFKLVKEIRDYQG